jgi:transcriptional regulator with XRE-family HTH domain
MHSEGYMKLRSLRRSRGLTLEAVAVLADNDLHASTLSRIERGLVRPRRETVVVLAKVLGTSARRMDEIIDEDAEAVR